MPKRPSLFLIDGSNNVYRSYYAIRGLTNSSGFATNAVYGFVNTLRKLLKDFEPDCIAVAFDEGPSTVRHEQFQDYKKDRKPMPDDLSVQIPFVYEMLDGFHIPIIRATEWEADDFLGTLACRARERGYDVVLATSDKDFFQLVGDNIRLFHTGREVMYDAKGATEAFGLPPEKVVDVMAIMGDAIDNIPGVPGIGEKGAKTLIEQFGSLDGVYANLDQIKRAAQRKALEENRDKAFLSRDLARIKCDLELDLDFETLKRQEPDRAKLHDLFSRLEFASLMQEYLPQAPPATKEFRVAANADDIRAFIAGDAPLGIWLEPATIDGFDAPIAAALAVSRSPLAEDGDGDGSPANGQRPTANAIRESLLVPLVQHLGATDEMTKALRDVLASNRVFVAYDAKAQSRRLRAAGLPIPSRWSDVMLMSYVINPGLPSHALGNIARDRLKQDVLVRKDVQKTATLFEIDHEVATPFSPYVDYLGEKSDITLALRDVLEPELRRDAALADIYERIEMPLYPVLAKMEERGIRIDVSMLRTMSETMGKQI
ncbi:MAG TPA: 5'-3' exonuclease H3TH domain-containing protein, partial [Thermoanaerobaculia bacterium]|nr:5'-3' exonuclease H3TH domain-containing protein [Thermoanaerobaculia bacterium]